MRPRRKPLHERAWFQWTVILSGVVLASALALLSVMALPWAATR